MTDGSLKRDLDGQLNEVRIDSLKPKAPMGRIWLAQASEVGL